MKYRFKNEVTPADFWVLSMHHTYHSTVGMCNIIFTVAMIGLTIQFGGKVHEFLETLMWFGCLLFPVFQPFFVFLRSKTQADMLPMGLELEFDDRGLRVRVGEQTQMINWKNVVSATKEYNMIIVRSDEKHGYIISDKMLGKKKEEFWNFIQSKLQSA